MDEFGVLARFEFTAGKEAQAEQFFQNGRLIVTGQPLSTVWFAFRVGPTTYGAFASFASSADREALLASGGPKSASTNSDLFAQPPSFDRVDIVAARHDHGPQ